MRFLHIIQDNGFLNYYIEIVEKIIPNQNEYIFIDKTGKKESLKSIFKTDLVKIIAYNSKSYKKLIKQINSYEKICIHFLSEECISLINHYVDATPEIIWFFWGADFYSPFNHFKDHLFDNASLKYYNVNDTFITTGSSIGDVVKKYKRKYIDRQFINNSIVNNKAQAILRINKIPHNNPYDIEVVKSYFKTTAEYQYFFYFEYDYSSFKTTDNKTAIIPYFKIDKQNKKVILLGNSASLSNNHLSAISYLKDFNHKDFIVICPLSYGDKAYAKKVIEYGKESLGKDTFLPLTSYLSKDEYAQLLFCTDIIMMNHKRTEAAGNVFMTLAMGKKVIMNENSNLLKFLKDKEIHIFNFDECKKNLLEDISVEQKQNNQMIICKMYSYENAMLNIKSLLTV